jgi:hypothetical protein
MNRIIQPLSPYQQLYCTEPVTECIIQITRMRSITRRSATEPADDRKVYRVNDVNRLHHKGQETSVGIKLPGTFPIALIPCSRARLRPAVSSLDACPTSAL